jgi:hypothetical protein
MLRETGVLCKWYIQSSLCVTMEVVLHDALKDLSHTNHLHITSENDNVSSSAIRRISREQAKGIEKEVREQEGL